MAKLSESYIPRKAGSFSCPIVNKSEMKTNSEYFLGVYSTANVPLFPIPQASF
jgi:hypothetical protein